MQEPTAVVPHRGNRLEYLGAGGTLLGAVGCFWAAALLLDEPA